MELLLVAMAAFILALQLRLMKLEKRLVEVEHTKAAVDILADQVSDLCGDFYGPSAE